MAPLLIPSFYHLDVAYMNAKETKSPLFVIIPNALHVQVQESGEAPKRMFYAYTIEFVAFRRGFGPVAMLTVY